MEKPSKAEIKLYVKLNRKIGELLQQMEKFDLAGYMQLLNSPLRFFWINFLGGLGRGVGVAIGATIIAAILLSFLRRLVVLNLPIIGDYIAELVQIVQNHL